MPFAGKRRDRRRTAPRMLLLEPVYVESLHLEEGVLEEYSLRWDQLRKFRTRVSHDLRRVDTESSRFTYVGKHRAILNFDVVYYRYEVPLSRIPDSDIDRMGRPQ